MRKMKTGNAIKPRAEKPMTIIFFARLLSDKLRHMLIRIAPITPSTKKNNITLSVSISKQNYRTEGR